MTDTLTERRLTALEKDAPFVHQSLLSIDTRLGMLEQTMEKGFLSVDKQLQALHQWLEDRLA